MRITVIGTGYLGATHAACMAELGFEVIGLDLDEARVDALSNCRPPFFEPGLEDLLRKHLRSRRLRFTTSYQEVADFGEVHFICGPTPQKRGGLGADLTAVHAIIDTLAPKLTRECLVVGKSTVPVGTAEKLAERIREKAPIGPGAELAWNPEFLREGNAVKDVLQPSRLVFGVASTRAERVLRAVHAPLLRTGVPLIVTDFATAELVKVAANAFLSTKISFINAMADMCDVVGADVTLLSEALSFDERIGRQFLNAGLGFGGECLPKDLCALRAKARELGVEHLAAFLGNVDAINRTRRTRIVRLAREQCDGTLSGKRVAVLGATFKPGSDDIRRSPALDVAVEIHLQGAEVCVWDPKAVPLAQKNFPFLSYASSAYHACDQADVVLLLTAWPEFRELDPEHLGTAVRNRRVVDGRNALDRDRWSRAGWTYRALGRPRRGSRSRLERRLPCHVEQAAPALQINVDVKNQ